MARPYPSPFGPDPSQEPNPDEWRALRGQLVELLDQVENEYARASGGEADVHGLADRMKSLREQVRANDTGERHQQALRSVKRAIDRFSDRDDGYMRGGREALESAISEIRGRPAPHPQSAVRHSDPYPPAEPPIPVAAARPDFMPRFDELGRAVGSIAARLEGLEAEIKAQRDNPAAMAGLKELAGQLAQVGQVVELLAGAVGETGHMKRLEAQIASLAKLVTQGHSVDLSALTQRLDDVSATVERLADLQLQHVTREKELPAQQEVMRQAIEASVRDVYERIELIEKNFLVAPADVHRLMDEMAQVSDALRSPVAPQQVAALVDALNARIDEIESGGREVRSLKGDMESMRLQLIQRLDLSSVTQRLDDVSSTVERMADQQARDRDDPTQGTALRSGIQAIEKSIRAIYDRVDSLEQTYALKPEDLDKLTTGLARITEAMQNPEPPHQLIALVDALNARIGEIEGRDNEVSGLKHEMVELREAVLSAVEPRLAAVETQLSALNERVAEQRPDTFDVSQMETQVRQLMARMDQTGEQITGLARLYAETSDREPPDYDALARMVADRTSEAVAAIRAEPVVRAGLSEDDLGELERRMRRLFEAAAHERPPEDFSAIYDGIRRVDDRLDRLEGALDRLATEVASASPPPLAAADMPAFTGVAAAAQPDTVVASPPPKRRPDTMPISPAEDRPLSDRPFPDLGPVKAALEQRIPTRKMHPGLDDEPMPLEHMSPITTEMLGGPALKPEQRPARSDTAPPTFDPSAVTPPPRPVPSFELGEAPVFSTDAGSSRSTPETAPAEPAPPGSRNTFIEAARRAAQRPSAQPQDAGTNSLIGRALARFQQGKKPAAVVPTAKPAKAAKPERQPKVEPQAKEPHPKAIEPNPEPGLAALTVDTPAPTAAPGRPSVKAKAHPVPGSEPPETFLVRHRQPILLAASVVAISFLTLNLINQRQAEEAAALPEAPTAEAADPGGGELGMAEAPVETPVAVAPEIAASDVATPRVIPIVDTIQTGAVDPAAARSFTPSGAMPKMPAAFTAIEDNTTAVTPLPVLDGPVKVELPPEAIGPIELRQAAADGDARAQFEVAAIYTEGRAVPQDLAIAAAWYERAAAQGFAPAQYRLASLYESGKGVDQDLDQARLWYQRAAEAGNRMSMHNLAALYAGGELGKQDFVAAAGWFEKAASQGMTDSQFNLGMLYARGLGVPQNMELSYKWFALAALSGDQDAAKARDDIARSLDADTVTRLAGAIETWKPTEINLPANFAPIGTWMADFDPGLVIDNREVILGVQVLLGRLGYDIGSPDGVAGPKTAEAIKAFERATGMSEIGAINPRLLAVLGSQPG